MARTQIYLSSEDLHALRTTARRTGSSVSAFVREAIERVWIERPSEGPVALWDGIPLRSSADHDSICDEIRAGTARLGTCLTECSHPPNAEESSMHPRLPVQCGYS